MFLGIKEKYFKKVVCPKNLSSKKNYPKNIGKRKSSSTKFRVQTIYVKNNFDQTKLWSKNDFGRKIFCSDKLVLPKFGSKNLVKNR